MSFDHLLLADPWVSMRHLQRAMVFLDTAGFDGPAIFKEAGLAAEQLENGEARVSLDVVEGLLGAFQRRHPDPFVGLKAAEDIQPSTLGALGFLLQSCATLADLLDVVVRFNGMMSNIGLTSLHHSPGACEIRWDCLAGSPALRRQLREYIIGINFTMQRLLLPGAPPPLAVRFSHPCPSVPGAAQVYAGLFRCPVHFEQPFTSVTVQVGMLQMRLPHGDAELKLLMERHTQQVFERRAVPVPSLMEEVDRLLESLVPAGGATKETVARQLGMSPRSLHRRLDEAGSSYQQRLDAVRLKMARRTLAAGDIAIAQLAELLGFSSPQVFMRWFRQQSGLTPGQFRQQAASGLA